MEKLFFGGLLEGRGEGEKRSKRRSRMAPKRRKQTWEGGRSGGKTSLVVEEKRDINFGQK